MKTLREVEDALRPFVEIAAQTTGESITIARTERLAAYLGNPEKELKIIHVAGTSGKTSTCYAIRHLLEDNGYRTGLTVSPHIRSIAERVQIAGETLEEAAFCRYLTEFMGLIDGYDETPSYFELMICFVYWVFVREQVEYAVIETGLGGQQDSTNIAQRSDKIAVITDIGFDHMHVLGHTLSEIASQKAGILSPGGVGLMYRQDDEVTAAVERVAAERDAQVIYVPEPDTKDFRVRNNTLAEAVYDYVAERDGLAQRKNDLGAYSDVPGRLYVAEQGGRSVIYDGAHNEQKTRALVETLQIEFPGETFSVVMAMKEGKEYLKCIDLLLPIARRVFVAEFQNVQDTPIHAIDAQILHDAWQETGIEVVTWSNLSQAVADASQYNEKVLVTGSLYAVSELLQ